MPRSSRRVRALVALTSAAVLATSCTSGADDEPSGRDAARWSAVELTAGVTATHTGVSFANLLPAVDAQPALVVGVERVREEPPLARAWRSDGSLLRPIDLPVEGDDAEDVGTAFVAGATTWVAGMTWTSDGGVLPYALSSADRSTWEAVELPEAAAARGFSAQAGAAAGDGVVLLGFDGERAPVAVVPGGELTDLPAPPDGAEFRGFAQAAVRGDVVVAVGTAAAPGQPGQHVVYRSDDGGGTWTAATGPAGEPAGLAGVAATDAGFLVTGSTVGPDNRAQPRAWWSTDGTTWQAESLPPDVVGEQDGLDEYYLGPPAAGGGRVVATLVNDGSLGLTVVQRDDAGRWTREGAVVDWDLPGIGALPAVQPDGSVLLAQSARNGGRLSELSGGVAAPVAALGRIDDGLGWTGFLDGAEPPVLLGERVQVDVEPDGAWTQTSPVSRYGLTDDGAVEPAPWDPPDSEGVDDLAAARGPDGSQVLMGSRVSGTGDATRANVVGWHRTGPDAPWTPVQGLDTPETELLQDVARLGDGWVAVGVRRPSFDAGETTRAAAWTSDDGVTWSRVADLPGAGDDSWAYGVCALGGDALVVGLLTEGARSVPSGWRRSEAGWRHVPPAAWGEGGGSLSSCTSGEDGTVVQGSSAGRETLWSADGDTFAPRELGGRGESFGRIRSVDGGFAAAGSRSTGRARGAVLWLSRDAEEWTPVPVPSRRVLGGVDVVQDGGSLFLAANSPTSPELWRLENPGDLLQE